MSFMLGARIVVLEMGPWEEEGVSEGDLTRRKAWDAVRQLSLGRGP